MKLLMKRTQSGLAPCYDSDYESLKKIKFGDEVVCEVKKPRNYRFHKLFFALLNCGFQNQDQFDVFEHFRAYILMKSGYVKTIATPKGAMFLPESISFASMDEYAFRDCYNDVLDQIIKFIDADKELFERELQHFM